MKKIRNFIRKICTFNIIMAKTTIASLDIMDDLNEINKTFNKKIKK